MHKKTFYVIILILLLGLGIGLIIISVKPIIKNLPKLPINIILPESSPDNSVTKSETTKVTRVIDGDTIELIDGRKVRYIGINAPETADPKKLTACFGREASLKNKELVDGKEVYLEKDISDKDKYGRLLRYVYIQDSQDRNKNIMVNQYLVKEGYAQVSTFPPDVKYQALFLNAQIEARDSQKGLWKSCIFMSSSPASVSASTFNETEISGKSGTIN